MTVRFIAATVLLIATGLTAACTAAADPTTSTETTEASNANKFPDLSSYTPVNPDDYRRETENPGRPTPLTGYYFNTPDGIRCSLRPKPSASCTGNNLPAIAPAVCEPVNGPVAVNGISTDVGIGQYGGSTCEDGSPVNKVLPPFHTLTVYGVTCGVDDKGTTACKDPQGRGFVLSPSWSGWLPKV